MTSPSRRSGQESAWIRRTWRRPSPVSPGGPRRYEAWKDYVWAYLLKEYAQPLRFEAGQKIVVSCYIEYRDGHRPDPGNVVKGIVDALADRRHRSKHGTWIERRLFPNDRSVIERAMDYSYSEHPGILVVVSELP